MGVWGEPRTKWVSERAASVTVVTGGHRVRSREPLETEERKRASGITRSPLVRSRWNSRVCLGLRRMVGVGHRRIGPRTVGKGPSVVSSPQVLRGGRECHRQECVFDPVWTSPGTDVPECHRTLLGRERRATLEKRPTEGDG